MLNDILVVCAIFHVGEVLESKPMMWTKMFVQNIGDE
jgi:hypothetical protein